MGYNKRSKMETDSENQIAPQSLLQLPDAAIVEVMRHLDAKSLVALELTSQLFHTRKPLATEDIAKELVLKDCGSHEIATRFRHRSWKERLYLERDTGCGFDKNFCEEGGFRLSTSSESNNPSSIRLTGMGPKLLLSDVSTKEQSVLRWRLRVKGNTAVEFGVVPVNMPSSHTALHKCLAVPGNPDQRCVGFCSQITAGSLLPIKAPVMRGTEVDIVARRGHLEVVLLFPQDAKEINWQNGQPIQRPYHGPRQLRFEQDFSPDHDVCLAITSWAKANFEILHVSNTLQHETSPVQQEGPVPMDAQPSVTEAALALHNAVLQQAVAQLPPAAAENAGADDKSSNEMNRAGSGSSSMEGVVCEEEQVAGVESGDVDGNVNRSDSQSTLYLDGHM